MFCHKCKVDVHPAQVLATRSVGEGSVANGLYNQCPRCQCPMPDMPVAEPVAVYGERGASPQPQLSLAAPTTPARGSAPTSMIDMARAELTAADLQIAQLQARIVQIKTDITLKKAHRAGLLKVVAAYEKAARAILPTTEAVSLIDGRLSN